MGLIVWAFLAFAVIPWVWVAIVGTYIILAFCSMTLVKFWSRTAWKMLFSGWVLWLVFCWASGSMTPADLERFGGSSAIPLLYVSVPWMDWPYHLLGMTLTGLTALVTWKMGESWHAQDKPEDFNPKYLDALRRD